MLIGLMGSMPTRFSDDRQWWWTGTEWRPISEYQGPVPPVGPPTGLGAPPPKPKRFSDDGQWWWTGTEWRPSSEYRPAKLSWIDWSSPIGVKWSALPCGCRGALVLWIVLSVLFTAFGALSTVEFFSNPPPGWVAP
jgi:hypothetical protein